MDITIFYSWQSQTEQQYNQHFIKKCIQNAVKQLKKKPDFQTIKFEIQDGVNRIPGSPKVANTIMDERVPNADIFIADLSVANPLPRPIVWLLSKLFKYHHRFMQNNCVMLEHGIAYHAIGENRIIGVRNSSIGSLNDYPEDINFDLRHFRFPIEYDYSKKTRNIDKVEKQLTDTLTEAIKTAAIYAIQQRKHKYNPFIIWSDWQESIESKAQKFITNAKITEISELIVQGLGNPKIAIRLLGLSGLGKSRILFELFRPKNDEKSIIFTGRVLYYDCNSPASPDYLSIFKKLHEKNEDKIVILDNCPAELHRSIQKILSKENNKVCLITVDSNPEEKEKEPINEVNYFVIKKEDLTSIVNEILDVKFKHLGEQTLQQIREFAQGIPMMAVLLAQSVENGEQYVGKLDDKELLNKLLGTHGSVEDNRTILKSCSIFSYFGYYDDSRNQMEFIANNKNITAMDGAAEVLNEKFTKTCEHYLKREIFERRGRLIGMRPFPLALSLALEWLELCTRDRLLKVIEDIAKLKEPARSQLSEGLAEHMKYLGYSTKAQELLYKIIGPDSPFDNAEVLNTELGSRLFRSFVEVNPIAVSDNLSRVFASKTSAELLLIERGRRNLIWTLEKLCFDNRTFVKSIKTMYAFALAENETWANNATGQFLHLFSIMLPGTEANLEDRWSILQWVFDQNNASGMQLALKAMSRGLNSRYFNRTLGAERQGSKKLKDFEPTPLQVRKYWDSILHKLVEFVRAGDQYSEMAGDIIASNIRGVCNAGLFETIIPYVQQVAAMKNNDWDKALSNLRHTKKYEKNTLSPNQLAIIDDLIKSLTKTDFITHYKHLSNAYTLDDDLTLNKEAVVVAVNSLADEFVDSNVPWETALPVFYQGAQMNASIFGRRLYERLCSDTAKIDNFIKQSLDALPAIPKDQRNPALLIGFVMQAEKEIRQKFYAQLSNSIDLSYMSFYVIACDSSGKEFLKLLFDLVDSGKCELKNFNAWRYNNALQNMTEEEMLGFSNKLFSYGVEGYAIVFELLFDPLPGGEERKKGLYPLYTNCIRVIAPNEQVRDTIDEYKWSAAICEILSNVEDPEFAKFINDYIISSITIENSYHLDHYIQKIYDLLIGKYFKEIWPRLSAALLSTGETYAIFYGLKHILGSRINGVGDIGRRVGILFRGDEEAIFSWCEANKPIAPAHLAELVPIFSGENNKYDEWHPISRRLLDNFGDIPEVLNSLSANIGTYSWSGSVLPLIEGEIQLYRSIENHKIKQVADWAASTIGYLQKNLEFEKNREAETYI